MAISLTQFERRILILAHTIGEQNSRLFRENTLIFFSKARKSHFDAKFRSNTYIKQPLSMPHFVIPC
ncbi:hypothetical protein PAUR_a3534 [Pseudoalteromonas aurantia 208]|uniref:Uncharacterized protein n=1 Tax=Pseudoalteromonas aurantia 208 TaxID=1314867 RepID=A0ABR9E6Z7_9GAMM|nr:hypothetical protein [Pseudoalteromonas aurantia 208]